MSRNSRSNGVGNPQGESAESGLCCFKRPSSGNSRGSRPPPPGVDQPKRCTDVTFLAFYIIFCLFMVIIGVFAISYGNPLRLTNGMDSFGNICGMRNMYIDMNFTGMDMSDKPYVFFFDRFHMGESRKICVKFCPETEIRNIQDLQDLHRNHSVSLCQYDFRPEFLGYKDASFTAGIARQMCPKLPYPATVPVLKRCIPKPTSGVGTEISDAYGHLNGLSAFKQILGDLAATWTTVLGLSALAFGVLMFCVHWITGFVAYAILVLSALTSIGFSSFLWWVYFDIKGTLDSTPSSQLLDESVKNEKAFLSFSVISTSFTLILLCIIFYLRKRVTWVVELFRQAGSALTAMPTLLLQPLCTYLILTLYFLIWLLVVLCLATADYPTSRSFPVFYGKDGSNSQSGTMTVIEYSEPAWVKYLWWVYVIGLIWCSEFILACQRMVIATSISTWYFASDRDNLRWIVFQSIISLTRFHLGSMALGSLLITVLRVPRLSFAFLQRVLKRWDNWKLAKLISGCCSSCLTCFENCLRMVHHNAYTVIAIQGVNFCPAARLALQALVSNALHISVINSVGDFVLFLTKVIVAGLTGLISILIFRNDERLYFYAIPVLVTLVFAYFVAHSVISVFEMAVDTLFLCFCEDHNMNEDSRCFSAPPRLLNYMTDRAAARRNRNRGASPVQQKTQIEDDRQIGEEMIPMKGSAYEVES